MDGAASAGALVQTTSSAQPSVLRALFELNRAL